MPREKRKRQERPAVDGGAAASHRRVQEALAQAQADLHNQTVSGVPGDTMTRPGRALDLRTALETLRTSVAHTEQAIEDVLTFIDEAIGDQPLMVGQPQAMSASDQAEQPDAHPIH